MVTVIVRWLILSLMVLVVVSGCSPRGSFAPNAGADYLIQAQRYWQMLSESNDQLQLDGAMEVWTSSRSAMEAALRTAEQVQQGLNQLSPPTQYQSRHRNFVNIADCYTRSYTMALEGDIRGSVKLHLSCMDRLADMRPPTQWRQ